MDSRRRLTHVVREGNILTIKLPKEVARNAARRRTDYHLSQYNRRLLPWMGVGIAFVATLVGYAMHLNHRDRQVGVSIERVDSSTRSSK